MPKLPPDQVIRHEVVLGRAEREIIRNTVESIQFRNYSSPIVAGLSDVTFTVTVASLLGLGIGAILDRSGIDPDWRSIIADMTPEQIKDWFESQNIVLGGIGFILGSVVAGPLVGGPIGAAAGSATAEGIEYAEEQTIEAGRGFLEYLANLHNQINEWAGIESDQPNVA